MTTLKVQDGSNIYRIKFEAQAAPTDALRQQVQDLLGIKQGENYILLAGGAREMSGGEGNELLDTDSSLEEYLSVCKHHGIIPKVNVLRTNTPIPPVQTTTTSRTMTVVGYEAPSPSCSVSTNESATYSGDLEFILNGEPMGLKNPDPEMTLVEYLRVCTSYTGTKLSCGQGGCGACTVMVSEFNTSSDTLSHYSVNACLKPLCSIVGKAVTTTEGMGSAVDGYNPVQDRIATGWGTQCGFCTPGFVMTTCSLLQEKTQTGCAVKAEELETRFDGNLCRCTGYRPILQAVKSFATDAPTPHTQVEIEDVCPPGSQGQTPIMCRSRRSVGEDKGHGHIDTNGKGRAVRVGGMKKAHSVAREKALKELAMKVEGQGYKYDGGREGIVWYRVVSFNQLWQLIGSAKDTDTYKLVRGNTMMGVYQNEKFDVYIDISAIPSLGEISLTDVNNQQQIDIGSAVTLTELRAFLLEHDKRRGELTSKYGVLASHIHMVANWHVRNVASWAGNLVMAREKGFPSDLATILSGADATLTVDLITTTTPTSSSKEEEGSIHAQPETRVMTVLDFVRTESFGEGKRAFVRQLHLPASGADQHMRTFRAALRPQNSHALLNAAFNAKLTASTITQCSIVIGAVGGDPSVFPHGRALSAPLTSELLKHVDLIKAAMSNEGEDSLKALYTSAAAQLLKEMKLKPLPEYVTVTQPEAKLAYRESLLLSFLYKFVLTMLHTALRGAGKSLPAHLLSAIEPLKRPVSDGNQAYKPDPSLYPVSYAIPKLAGHEQAAGEAEYVDDLPSGKSDLYAAFVLAGRCCRTIEGIKADKALAVDGVEAFVGASDVVSVIGGSNTPEGFGGEEVFASRETLYVGQPVGMVIATSQRLANEAARLVEVEYGAATATPILTLQDAMDKRSFYSLDFSLQTIASGNVEEGLKNAPHVASRRVSCGGQSHFYMEKQTAYCTPADGGTRFTLYSSTQDPQLARRCVSSASNTPPHHINVVARRVGGAYGGKLTRMLPAACACMIGAKIMKTAVRMATDITTDMTMNGGRNPFLADYRVGYSSGGVITALDISSYQNAGCTLDYSIGVCHEYNEALDSVYYVPNWRSRVFPCRTNLPSNTAVRSFGHIQSAFIIECVIEDVARQVGKTPEAVRELNMYSLRNAVSPTGQPLEHYTMPTVWSRVKDKAGYADRVAEIEQYNAANRWRKRGLAITPVKYGVGWHPAGALLNVSADGTVLIFSGGVEMGQGLLTKVTQVAAKTLGVPIDKIVIGDTNTHTIPNFGGTGGSVGSGTNAEAVRLACEELKARLSPVKDKLIADNDGKVPSWETLVSTANRAAINLSVTGYFAAPGTSGVHEGVGGQWWKYPSSYFNFGACCVEAEIDVLTGEVELRRADLVYDCGQSLNPAVDIGQIEGGFIMGVGYFLREEVLTGLGGETISNGTWEYKPPCSLDIPISFNVELLKDCPFPKGILRSKASGEPPMILSRAAYGAVKAAIEAARKERGVSAPDESTGDVLLWHSPLTVDRVQQACHVTVGHMSDTLCLT